MDQLDKECMSKKELLIQSTLELINEKGLEGVTVRKIAALADVNVSLVNYYFGSKEKLINEVIQLLMNSLKESFTILDIESIEPKERLKLFLLKYVDAHRKYPFIARKMIVEEFLAFDSHKEFVRFIHATGIHKLKSIIEQLTGDRDPERLMIMLSHLLGATFLPVLIEPFYESFTSKPLPNVEKRIDLLLDRYFPTK